MEKFGIWMTIGGSTTDDATRRLGWGLPDKEHGGGWFLANGLQKYMIDGCRKVRDAGMKPVIILHNPWGIEGGEAMDFDQRIECMQNPLLTKMSADFDPWLRYFLKPLLGDDGEGVLYVGSIGLDHDMKDREADPNAFASRAHRSLMIDQWLSIGADTAAALMENDPGYSVWKLRRDTGQRIYIEPRPKIGAATIGWPVICDGPWWHRSNPAHFPDAAELYATDEECGDDIIRFVFTRHGDAAKRREWYERIKADGHTLAVTPSLIDAALEAIA